jgi:hypothetical protein
MSKDAVYNRDVMIINSRVLRAIAATLRGAGWTHVADELEFVAQSLMPPVRTREETDGQ